MQPLSGPAPVTLPLPNLAPLAPPAEAPPSIGFGPSSTDPTLEMDMRAFATFTSSDNDVDPTPSERTEVSAAPEPILLVAKKRAPLQSFEIPPPAPPPADPTASASEREPITVHRSGTLPRADPAAFSRTLTSFNDSARRA